MLEQQLGALKPALMKMLQRRCDEADCQEGGLEAVGSAALLDKRKPLALDSGAAVSYKGFGSALPPLSSSGRRQPLPLTENSGSAPNGAPVLRKKNSITPVRTDSLNGERGSPVVTPLSQKQPKGGILSPIAAKKILNEDPLLSAAPQYSQILGGSRGRSGSVRPIGVDPASGVLDAAEEQLNSYLMDDQR